MVLTVNCFIMGVTAVYGVAFRMGGWAGEVGRGNISWVKCVLAFSAAGASHYTECLWPLSYSLCHIVLLCDLSNIVGPGLPFAYRIDRRLYLGPSFKKAGGWFSPLSLYAFYKVEKEEKKMKGVHASVYIIVHTYCFASGMCGHRESKGSGKWSYCTPSFLVHSRPCRVLWESHSVAKRPHEELGSSLGFGLYWNFHGISNIGLDRVTKFKTREF